MRGLIPPGTRGNKVFYFRSRFGGKQHEISTGTANRKAAERFVVAYLSRLEPGAVQAQAISFAQAATAYLAARTLRKDDKVWIKRIGEVLGDKPVAEIYHADLVAVCEALLPGLSNATKNRNVITPASAVLHYAAEQNWCPYRRFKRFKVSSLSPRRPSSDADIARLLAATEGPRHLLLLLLYETGLRITDALALQAPAGKISMARIAKTDQRLQLPLSPALAERLAEAPRYEGDYLFPWRDRSGVYKWLRPLVRELGVTYTPHMSRHALATDLLRRGIPDRQAAEYGAWRDVKSLHRYQHVEPTVLAGRSYEDLVKKTGGN